jgi:hypothetical protein
MYISSMASPSGGMILELKVRTAGSNRMDLFIVPVK